MSNDTTPNPRRTRALRIGLAVSIVLFLAVGGAIIVWGHSITGWLLLASTFSGVMVYRELLKPRPPAG